MEIAEALNQVKIKSKKKGATGKANIFNYFGKAHDKGTSKSNTDLKDPIKTTPSSLNTPSFQNKQYIVASSDVVPAKQIRKLEESDASCANFSKNKKLKTDLSINNTKSISSENSEDMRGASTEKSEIYNIFKKVFSDLDPNSIHSKYFCQERNCNEICLRDLADMNKDNKFQHKWVFDPDYAFCKEAEEWHLIYIDGRGMFCTLCRTYDTKQKNGLKQWNSVPNVRCRPQTITNHLESDMHKDALRAKKSHKSSYFDKEEEKKLSTLKNASIGQQKRRQLPLKLLHC